MVVVGTKNFAGNASLFTLMASHTTKMYA